MKASVTESIPEKTDSGGSGRGEDDRGVRKESESTETLSEIRSGLNHKIG
jgi:hypothetical protein